MNPYIKEYAELVKAYEALGIRMPRQFLSMYTKSFRSCRVRMT